MKKMLFCFALLMSGSVFATTDHYILRDGNHVQHLKIVQVGDKLDVRMAVNFEPNANEKDAKICAAEIEGDAKIEGENKITLKKRSEGEAAYCTLDITLSPTGAKVEQSKDCDNFATGICRFSSGDKELIKIK